MPELTREEKLKLVEKLPQRLQDFLYSEDTGAFLLYLGQKYNLPLEKVSALSKIVADIILKITPITSLAQEIVNKVTPDHQAAMAIAQELNSELLAPVLIPAPTPTQQVGAPTPAERGVGAAPPIIAMPAVPITPTPMPVTPIIPSTPVVPQPIITPSMPKLEIPTLPPVNIGTDRYREPVSSAPEIIDLRKTPPSPLRSFSEGGLPPGLPVAAAPIPPVVSKIEPPRPLTFTKPVEPIKPVPSVPLMTPMMPLIEAEPHHEEPPKTIQEERPQFIIRPPGLAPTDMPHDVLDLRKDKGEF